MVAVLLLQVGFVDRYVSPTNVAEAFRMALLEPQECRLLVEVPPPGDIRNRGEGYGRRAVPSPVPL